MNNLYKNIYEAINTGIQKALILDQDVSMNYQDRKISNNPDMMQYYVNDFINATTPDQRERAYQEIDEYYKHSNSRYMVKTINEFALIFNQLKTYIFFSDSDKKVFDLEWIDTKRVVTFITKAGSELAMHEIKNIEDIQFIKFIDTPCGHPIILHKNINNSAANISNFVPSCAWVDKFYTNERPIQSPVYINNICCNYQDWQNLYDQAKKDYAGFEHTYEILNNPDLTADRYYAMDYARSQSIGNYIGYLPALGELVFLQTYSLLIGFLVKCINPDVIKDTNFISNFDSLWSSTEFNNEKVYRTARMLVDRTSKTISCCKVIPFFKEK